MLLAQEIEKEERERAEKEEKERVEREERALRGEPPASADGGERGTSPMVPLSASGEGKAESGVGLGVSEGLASEEPKDPTTVECVPMDQRETEVEGEVKMES